MKLRFTVFGYEVAVVALEFDEHHKPQRVSLSERVRNAPRSWLRSMI